MRERETIYTIHFLCFYIDFRSKTQISLICVWNINNIDVTICSDVPWNTNLYVRLFFHLYDNLTASDSEVLMSPRGEIRFFTLRMNRASSYWRREAWRKQGTEFMLLQLNRIKKWRNRILNIHIHSQRIQVYLS